MVGAVIRAREQKLGDHPAETLAHNAWRGQENFGGSKCCESSMEATQYLVDYISDSVERTRRTYLPMLSQSAYKK